LVRLAAVGVLAAALGLSACGRKGPLDPPPSAAIPMQEPIPGQAPGPVSDVAQPTGRQQPADSVIAGRESTPGAPPPSGRGGPFFLDWLLN
jgi:predicted small lipoprotein YifL